MVTGATEQIGNRHDMTGVHEEVTYCSPSTSSGKQKQNHSTSEAQFRSENTPAAIEANQFFLALQRLVKNNNSAIVLSHIIRSSKLRQNGSRERCPRSMGKLKNLSCLTISSKRASKFTDT